MNVTGISIELQDIALASLLRFQPILSKCADSIEETFFATEGYRFIFRCLRNYFLKYTVLPTEAELSVFIQNAYTEKVALVYGSLENIQSAYARLLTVEINSEEFAQRQVVEFIRRCNIEISLGKAQDSLQDGTIDLDKVREDLIKDLTVDFAKIVPLNLADVSKVTATRQEVFGGYNPIIIKFFIEPINDTFQYGGMSAGTLNAVCAPAGRGKLLANDTPILTKDGWKKHGDLKVGDYVIGMDGQFKKVIHVHPKYFANRCVEFSNGEKILCHENHEWLVSVNKHAPQVRETRAYESMKLEVHKDDPKNHRYTCMLPNKDYIVGEEKDLPVKPYTLGVWLGDGTNKHPKITSPFSDLPVIEGVKADGYEVLHTYIHKTTGVPTYVLNFRDGLKTLGMCNYKFATEKYIPEMYLTASIEQRLDLLAGLLDTDGCFAENKYRFATTSERLRDTFCELVSTFGWRTSVYARPPKVSTSGIVGRKIVYEIGFTPDCEIPCRLPRKQNKITRTRSRNRIAITKIYEIEPVEGNCITVDGDGMYLAGKTMLPTHNTTLLINQGLYTAQQGFKVLHVFLGDMNKMDGWYRYASILSEISTQKISKLSDEKFTEFIQKFNTAGYLGNIEIITIPAKRFTASQLVEEIVSIQERGNIHYDCIIIDYDKNLADGGEDSMYKLGGQVYDTFASFAVDNLSVIMIASQPKIGFWDKEILPLEALSESSKKQEIVDFLLTLGKPVKNSSIGTLYIAKNRRGKDCKTCRIGIDGDTGRMRFITEEEFTNIKMSERGK